MIHLDSQEGCDDSIQLNSYFLGAQKGADSQFQIVLALRSTIQLWFFQSYGKLEQIQLNSIIHEIQYKMLQIHPFAHLPHLLPTKLANQLQSSQLCDVDGRGDYDYCWVPGTRQLSPVEVGEHNSEFEPKK